jgi:hypothetical protein
MALLAARLNAASIFSKSIPRGVSFMAHFSMDARVEPGHDGAEVPLARLAEGVSLHTRRGELS